MVSSKGASVTPFELKVDKRGWHQAKNHGRPRRVSRTSEIEFKRQIELLLELGVLRPSREGYYQSSIARNGYLIHREDDHSIQLQKRT